MKRLVARVELTTNKAIECASVNFENVDDNVLTLSFKWTNKNTSVKSFENYVKDYLRNFDSFKRSYKIQSLDLIEVV